MGRTPKPWWWEDRGAYYATVHGTRVKLGSNLKAARDKLKVLASSPLPSVRVKTCRISVVLDQFLDWTKNHRAPKTYRWYRDFIESFVRKYPEMEMADLTPLHVTDWLRSKDGWNDTTRRGAIGAIQRGLNWAVRNTGLAHNPIRGMEKPSAQHRTEIITLPEFKKLLRAVKHRQFRRLLVFCWDCGCRPQEARQLASRHIDLERRRGILPRSEAKGKKRPRVIYFATERAVRIVKQGMKQDRIFLNTHGRPWTSSAVKCRFSRLEESLGKRYRQYDLRHSWITRKLVANVDSLVVATLAGHADTKMLDQVYSHVSDNYTFLLAQSKREP